MIPTIVAYVNIVQLVQPIIWGSYHTNSYLQHRGGDACIHRCHTHTSNSYLQHGGGHACTHTCRTHPRMCTHTSDITHTHVCKHTDDPHRINFTKPGSRSIPGLKSNFNRIKISQIGQLPSSYFSSVLESLLLKNNQLQVTSYFQEK